MNQERRPILSYEDSSQYDLKKINKQWELVYACIFREIETDQNLRQALLKFCAETVSEQSANDLLRAAAEASPRVRELAGRYQDSLGAYIGLDIVPDEEIMPDLMNAHKLGNINEPESKLVARRYEMARDVKRLALGAEILEQEQIAVSPGGYVTLPSGTKIYIDRGKREYGDDLLRPQRWEKRIQLKDRVYAVATHDRWYILKERKTRHHRHHQRYSSVSDKGGYPKDGYLTSAEEYAVARYFESLGAVTDGNTRISWEKPIGHVAFPDGFSFTMFEYDLNMTNEHKVFADAEKKVTDNPEIYGDDFEIVKGLFETMIKKPRVFDFENINLGGLTMKRYLSKAKKRTSYADYAKVKTYYSYKQTEYLLKKHNLERGFYDPDTDGYAFRLCEDPKILMDVVAFDFERYKGIQPPQTQSQAETEEDKRGRAVEIQTRLADSISLPEWPDGSAITPEQMVLYAAMMIRDNPDYVTIVKELEEYREQLR